MKSTNDSTTTDAARRGLFRRARRVEAGDDATNAAVATVDELARRMDELAEDGRSVADDPVHAEFELQRAVIARANDLAATSTGPEATMQQTDLASTDDDFEARLDAALQPLPEPVAPAAQPQPQLEVDEPVLTDAVLAPVQTSVATTGPAAAIGIDIDRVVRTIVDEAAGVQHRIEMELRAAQDQAGQIVDQAEAEAEQIREHGQAQARVLLGEVEEIISEAQQTGEQILLRANEEASTLRADATSVMTQAQTEARAIVETARREGEQVLAEQRRLATVRAQEAMREQDRLKDQIRRLEERRRQVLESLEPLISQLTQMMPAGAKQPATPQNVVPLQRQQQPAAKG